MSVKKKALRTLENTLYHSTIDDNEAKLSYPKPYGTALFDIFSNDQDVMKIEKNRITPQNQDGLKIFLLKKFKCRAVVSQSDTHVYFCGRSVHDLESNNDAARTFCTFHSLCNYAPEEIEYDEIDGKTVTFKRYPRCSNFRTKLNRPLNHSITHAIDSEFSLFCHEHDERFTKKCRTYNTEYQKICKPFTPSSDNNGQDEIKDNIRDTELTPEKCNALAKCYKERTDYKNNCSSYTEDNGHYYARLVLLNKLQQCAAKHKKAYDILDDRIQTYKQPYIIDNYNSLYQQFDNKKKSSGGAPRRKHSSRRRSTRSSRRRSTRSFRRRRKRTSLKRRTKKRRS